MLASPALFNRRQSESRFQLHPWPHPPPWPNPQPDPDPRLESRPDDQPASPSSSPRETPSQTPGAPEGVSRDTAANPSRKKGFDRKKTGHGLLNAGHFSNRWRVAARHIMLKLVSLLPGTHFKTRLTRRLFGMSIGEDVGLAYRVMFDAYDPTMISIGDNVIIGTESRIFVHTFMLDRQRVRPVKIGSNVQIGAFCVIAPGVQIGDGASIGPCTLVSRNVPAGAIVTGHEMRIRTRKQS